MKKKQKKESFYETPCIFDLCQTLAQFV